MGLAQKNRTLLTPRTGKISFIIFSCLLIISGYRAYELFGFIFKPNVIQDTVVYIPTGSSYTDVETIVCTPQILSNPRAFKWISKKKSYKENIKPGRYEIKKGWNTSELVNMLRIGNQSPIKVTFNNVRFSEDLAGKVSHYFETDSISFLKAITNESNMKKYGFTNATFPAMFIPNTYEFYWNTTPDQFMKKMSQEYKKFWNESRSDKAKELGLSPVEVSILASIVQEETIKQNEKPKVAGLYLNRIKRGMLLQADPTIKFAIHDFSVRRITNDMLKTKSPYNTYKVKGLPPGPINFAEISSIDAVLNAENHNYLYMCAKEDFSGFHNFARTLTQHNINAAKYRRTLNKNKIWK